MSTSLSNTPYKSNSSMKHSTEDNNNKKNVKDSERSLARTFINWYRNLVDNERHNLVLYLADDVILEWFGRTIRTRKKASAFLKFHMQSSRHDFQTVDSIDAVETRYDMQRKRYDSKNQDSPFSSPDLIQNCKSIKSARKRLHSKCLSPEWDPEVLKSRERKRLGSCTEDISTDTNVIYSKGDGLSIKCAKRKCLLVTPPNNEHGQGDCLPSTSGTADSMTEKSHAALNSQLQRRAVECNGYVEFMRTRNSRSVEAMQWERKCKLQISYSEDPLNIGEYIIWGIHYNDDSKCRRNLLAAFEEVANEDISNKAE